MCALQTSIGLLVPQTAALVNGMLAAVGGFTNSCRPWPGACKIGVMHSHHESEYCSTDGGPVVVI